MGYELNCLSAFELLPIFTETISLSLSKPTFGKWRYTKYTMNTDHSNIRVKPVRQKKLTKVDITVEN